MYYFYEDWLDFVHKTDTELRLTLRPIRSFVATHVALKALQLLLWQQKSRRDEFGFGDTKTCSCGPLHLRPFHVITEMTLKTSALGRSCCCLIT